MGRNSKPLRKRDVNQATAPLEDSFFTR